MSDQPCLLCDGSGLRPGPPLEYEGEPNPSVVRCTCGAVATGAVVIEVKRPTGWKPNPQAMAMVSNRAAFSGSAELVAHSPDTDTWLTPLPILRELGQFDLDPCAAESNPHWVCRQSFTWRDDGLSREWTGRVFCNPPFSDTRPWIKRHADHGVGILLVPASVESRIWQAVVWRRAKAILFLSGRTRFCRPDGSLTTGRPLRSIALIAWSIEDAEILKVCSLAGVIVTEWGTK